jgi:hypothetical protein
VKNKNKNKFYSYTYQNSQWTPAHLCTTKEHAKLRLKAQFFFGNQKKIRPPALLNFLVSQHYYDCYDYSIVLLSLFYCVLPTWRLLACNMPSGTKHTITIDSVSRQLVESLLSLLLYICIVSKTKRPYSRFNIYTFPGRW